MIGCESLRLVRLVALPLLCIIEILCHGRGGMVMTCERYLPSAIALFLAATVLALRGIMLSGPLHIEVSFRK